MQKKNLSRVELTLFHSKLFEKFEILFNSWNIWIVFRVIFPLLFMCTSLKNLARQSSPTSKTNITEQKQ